MMLEDELVLPSDLQTGKKELLECSKLAFFRGAQTFQKPGTVPGLGFGNELEVDRNLTSVRIEETTVPGGGYGFALLGAHRLEAE
jgi:hypothetical protein